jgi:hypothetical protein
VTVSAIATISHSTLVGNQAVGGAGGTCGNGQGGGVANLNAGDLVVSNSLIALNRAGGGAGELGGNGQGGGVFNGGAIPIGPSSLSLRGSLVGLNRAEGGAGDGDTAGQGVGGGLYLAPGGVAIPDLTFVFANDASTSDDDVFGILV